MKKKPLRTVAKKARPDYKGRSQAGCLVYTIEVVVRQDEFVADSHECIASAIDNLRGSTSAELVGAESIGDTYEEACDILRQRALR